MKRRVILSNTDGYFSYTLYTYDFSDLIFLEVKAGERIKTTSYGSRDDLHEAAVVFLGSELTEYSEMHKALTRFYREYIEFHAYKV